MSQDPTVRRDSGADSANPPDAGGSDPAPAPTDTHDFRVGDLIGEKGRYQLLEILGHGAMGTVFLAKDHLAADEYDDPNPYVAIKFLSGEFATHPQARIALQREAKKARDLAHPNIVKVYHFAEHSNDPYMVMEYMRGKPLDDFLRERAGPIPYDEALPIVRDMSSGLAYIHRQKMVHCDFKPGNVFIAEDGTAKILDLGIARVSSQAKHDNTTRFDVGTLNALTPLYASPEMFERQAPDPRDDIYALGCMVYEFLAGTHPFGGSWSIQARSNGQTPARIEGLSARRWRALERALSLTREGRIASAVEFAEEFEAKRNPWKRRLVGVGLLSAAAAGVLGALLVQSDPDEAFVRELLESAGSQTLSVEDENQIRSWIEQGNAYIGFARDSFARSSAAAGNRDLRGGADNAEHAFRSVLALSPNEGAARGLVAIVEAYADGAEQLIARSSPTDALWLACQGYDIHPNNRRIRDLVEQLGADSVAKGEDVAGVCGAIGK